MWGQWFSAPRTATHPSARSSFFELRHGAKTDIRIPAASSHRGSVGNTRQRPLTRTLESIYQARACALP